MIALAKQAQQWEQELKDLTAEQVAERFQEMAQQSRAAEPKLQTSQDIFEKAKAAVAKEQEQFDSLTDPLLRLAKQEFVAEKSKITKKLYGFAELELPAELKEQADDTASPSDVQSGGVSTQATEQYQNLLATRSRILEEQDKQKEVLKEKLTTFDQRVQAYLKLLNEADQRLQQQYANAVELKKRIGRQQLQGEAIPDGITEALNRERIEQIEGQIADLASEHVDVEQEIEDLSQADENFEKLHTAFTDTLTAVGKRVDLLKDEDALKREY
ncbi:hypothetical protein C2W62_37075 [Candidatus Entotheonella serta]|nr:hypothetical protein C2W62_37075 [Candidatus Entotheonella serta]